jgi:hypothetical protein
MAMNHNYTVMKYPFMRPIASDWVFSVRYRDYGLHASLVAFSHGVDSRIIREKTISIVSGESDWNAFFIRALDIIESAPDPEFVEVRAGAIKKRMKWMKEVGIILYEQDTDIAQILVDMAR